jgi:Pvc16 N-terminal domain
MSNALAIATVTHVLSTLLKEGLSQNNVASFLKSGSADVSTRSPGILSGANGTVPAQLNMFLYRVSHNTGWNNVAYPSRNSNGDEIRGVPLAINLHYLLTAIGEDELDSEVLMGFGMQILHEQPVLSRALITSFLTDPLLSLYTAPLRNEIKLSGLADQIELIKLTPESINTEEMSRLWSAFQTKYHPCTGYQITVVLIEKDKPVKTGLPVKSRFIKVLPFRYPALTRVLSKAVPADNATEFRRIHLGDTLMIEGNQLSSESAILTINGNAFPTDTLGDTTITLVLNQPVLPASQLRAGLQTLQVQQSTTVGVAPDTHDTNWATSNILPFILSPQITLTNPLPGAQAEVHTDIIIGAEQRVVFLLNELSVPTPAIYSFTRPKLPGALDTQVLNFSVQGVKPGKYAIRIQVDGAESPFEGHPDDLNGPQILTII